MADIRKPLDGFGVSVMLALCLTWGMQQVALKVGAVAITPVMQIAIRSTVAALMVAAVMVLRAVPLFRPDRTLGPGIAAGLLFAGEFLFAALGLGYTTASHMSVFLYTSPIFTALGLHVWVPGERMRPVQWLGVGLAFAGVAAAFSNGLFNGADMPAGMWIGDAFGILAGFLWGMTTVVIRATALSEAPPTKTLLYQLAAAGAVLGLFALVTGTAGIGDMTPLVWASLGFQTVAVGFASLLVWFWLLRRYLASRLAVFSFLTPMFGIVMGVLLLHEPFEPAFGVGALLILAGIFLVNMPRRA